MTPNRTKTVGEILGRAVLKVETIFGFRIAYPEPGIIYAMREALPDQSGEFLWIDGEQGGFVDKPLIPAMNQMIIACERTGMIPLCRVPFQDRSLIAQLLNLFIIPGGIIFPHVDTEDQAREIVKMCKFPPLGDRGCYSRHLNSLCGPDHWQKDVAVIL
jgi:2-keto-3-deoxy-L-rhamnonate aldolase RhmA